MDALFDESRRKPNLKNRIDDATETRVRAFAIEQPAYGQVRTSNELRKAGVFISPSGVRSIWLRHGLASFKQRLGVLEKHVAATCVVLTEAQVVALEKKADDNVAHGEIETAHPGYPGSQDTFYVGTIKGVGRIYQQTFVDTYSKWAAAKLYTTKTPITAADLLNDRVLPAFAEQGMSMLRILTDHGTEYCGRPNIWVTSPVLHRHAAPQLFHSASFARDGKTRLHDESGRTRAPKKRRCKLRHTSAQRQTIPIAPHAVHLSHPASRILPHHT